MLSIGIISILLGSSSYRYFNNKSIIINWLFFMLLRVLFIMSLFEVKAQNALSLKNDERAAQYCSFSIYIVSGVVSDNE